MAENLPSPNLVNENVTINKLSKESHSTIVDGENAASVQLPNDDGITQNQNKSSPQKETISVPAVATRLEHGFQNFLNPLLAEMAQHVKTNEDILDQINNKLLEDRENRRKARLSAHIPDELKGSGKNLDDVMNKLEEIITADQLDTPQYTENASIASFDDYSRASILARGLAVHVQSLGGAHRQKVTEKISVDCQHWITGLFRFPDGHVIYHDHEWEGVISVGRLALHQHYTKYSADGFEALYSRPPVIYVSATSNPDYRRYISLELGLPTSCVTVVPCNTVFGSNHKMDVAVFERLVQDDIAAAKTPLLLIANAGTPDVGQVDKLERLQDICEKNSIWLHIEGSQLATLALFVVPSAISPAKSGDSMTVTLAPWLGIAGLPCATLYKKADPILSQSIGLNVDPTVALKCLPLWVCLQRMGHEGVAARIQHSCDLAEMMCEKLKQLPSIKQLTKEKEKKEEKALTLSNLVSKAVNAMLIFEIVSPTVVFKFCPSTDKKEVVQFSLTEAQLNWEESTQVYYNSLNIWLAKRMMADNPAVYIKTVDVEREGVCIRFCPLELPQAYNITKEIIEEFMETLQKHIEVLQITVNHRCAFSKLVEEDASLCLIDNPHWAGLGIVQYIPENSDDIGVINSELASKLKAADSAFSVGDCDGTACIRFGLISSETNVADLVAMVTTVGKEVEESSKYLEKMSDVIRRGIDEMNKELEKEVENKLRQEGVLRQVPLVSSLVNWWSPPPKSTLTGRSFNIQSGKIHSTQDTYKYHMQVQEEQS